MRALNMAVAWKGFMAEIIDGKEVAEEVVGTPQVLREVGALLAAPQRMAAMAKAARAVAKPDAAQRIADELLALAGR